MPTFGTAAYPTSGTVITRAYAVANLVDPINWLRALTGGGDPPAADRVIVSTSTTATNWAQITTAVLADANVTDVKLALQKVQAATPLATSFGGLLGANKNGFYLMGSPGDAPVAGHSYYAINIVDFTNPTTYNCQLAVDNADPTQMYIRLIIAGAGRPGTRSGTTATTDRPRDSMPACWRGTPRRSSRRRPDWRPSTRFRAD
jgi:hypothetical protein